MTTETAYQGVRERADRLREEVAEAALASGRPAEAVRIVAVTKGHPPAAVEAALAAGLRDLGENRVESLVERAGHWSSPEVRWHMIGRLQRRQAPEVHGVAHRVHSVDTLRLAERLSRTSPGVGHPLRILLQFNTSGEAAKAGLEPEEAVEVAGSVLELPGLEVTGVMTMAPLTDDEGILRETFAGLRRIQERLTRELSTYLGSELSMGMSNDFRLAVEEGSTMVRLGTILFGEREAG